MAQTNESQEQVTVNVETLQPVTRTLMTIGALPTSYLISMTYEEQLLWLQNYLIQTVIPAINNNAEATQEVQDIVMSLQDYINDYFNNLDVQEEINNKLDEMAQDGSLTNLIENYVNPYIETQNQEIANFKTSVNAQIATQNAQIQAVTSGSPLVATSVSGMTDTTRVYVNTTDGKWYYYNGSAWTIGGVYQATQNDIYYFWIGSNGRIIINKSKNNYVLFHIAETLWVGKNSATGLTHFDWADLTTTFTERVETFNGKNFIKLQSNEALYFDTADNQVKIGAWPSSTTLIPLLINKTKNLIGGKLYDLWLKFGGENTITTVYIANDGNVEIFDGVPNTSSIYFYLNNPFVLNKDNKYIGSYSWTNVKNLNNERVETINNIEYFRLDQSECLYIDLMDNTLHLDTLTNLVGYTSIVKLLENGNKNVVDGEFYKIWLKRLIAKDYYAYIANNKDLEIIENNTSIGADIYVRCEDAINLKANNVPIMIKSYSWNDLLTNLSENVVTFNDKQYIKLESYECLYVDLRGQELKIGSYNEIKDYKNIVLLILNGYNSMIGGILFDYWLKKKSANLSQIFNSAPYDEYLPIVSKCSEFSNAVGVDNSNIESYVFFTDPHLMGNNDELNSKLESYIGTLQKVYNSTPASFIVCGGDWLNADETDTQAIYKLGYVDGFMNSMFKDFYNVVGNHDIRDDGSIQTQLTPAQMTNLWFRKQGKTYYKFSGAKSMNYVLDNSSYSSNAMDSYKWRQINWLAQELIADDPEHATIFEHIIANPTNPTPFTDNLTKLLNAFNNHTTITLNSISYDFSTKTGHVDYVIGGHEHQDKVRTVNNILCITTTSFLYNTNSTPTFDFIVNDYTNNKVKLLRFGSGTNREYNI